MPMMVTAFYEKSSLERLDLLLELPNSLGQHGEVFHGETEVDVGDLVLVVDAPNRGRSVG